METNILSAPNTIGAGLSRPTFPHVTLGLATEREREEIYRIRHKVYAQELGQHTVNSAGRLSDLLDVFNIYLVAKVDGKIAGFISITPPGAARYSIDKYLPRESLPLQFDGGLYEVRLLTVCRSHRGREFAFLLM